MKELLEKLQKLGRHGQISSVDEINFVRRRNKNRPQTKKISTADEIRTDYGTDLGRVPKPDGCWIPRIFRQQRFFHAKRRS